MSVITVAMFTSIILALSFKNHQNSGSKELKIENIFKVLFNCLEEAYFRKETKTLVIPFSIKLNFKHSLHILSNSIYWPWNRTAIRTCLGIQKSIQYWWLGFDINSFYNWETHVISAFSDGSLAELHSILNLEQGGWIFP